MDSHRLQAACATPTLDFDELTARCLGRSDLVDKILDKFQASMGPELQTLGQASHDLEALAGIAHRIRGSALTMSAHGLSARAEMLEKAAVAGQREYAEVYIAEITEEWSRVCELISRSPMQVN